MKGIKGIRNVPFQGGKSYLTQSHEDPKKG
jgi:hypothetical protein